LTPDNRKQLDRLPSGIAGLDAILGGGFFKGGIYIVQGPPGTGKTTLANQICCHHAARGERTIYTTLLAEYHGRMMLHLGTMSFFDTALIPDNLTYLNGLGTLTQDGYPALRDMLRREVTSRQADILVLDGFATFQRNSKDAQDVNQFVHELQGIASGTNCTMFLLSSAERIKETPEYTMVDGVLELTESTQDWASQSTLQVLKLRGSSFLRGRHAFEITGGGLKVYPRIEALLAKPSRPDFGIPLTMPSGNEGLDGILGGGLPAASTTVVMGPIGSGKTTLGLQFLSRCDEAEPGLILGFHEMPGRLAAKAARVCPSLCSLLEAGTVETIWLPPTGGILDAYGEMLVNQVRRRGVKRLLIDSLDVFQEADLHSKRLGQFFAALMNELRLLNVTTVCTLESTAILTPEIRSPSAIRSLMPDNLILLRYIERDARLHRLISVLKVRDADFDPAIYEYVTSAQGLRIKRAFSVGPVEGEG